MDGDAVSDEPVICANCRNLINRGERGREAIWYDLFCGAVKKKEAVDFVTGKKGYSGTNDLGGRYVDDEPHPYAREVNPDGKCCLFEPAGLLKRTLRKVTR